MPCESCAVQFSVFRRKRACSECERLYCGACLRRGGGMCAPCRALSTRPLQRHAIAHLKVRDLQCFLQRQNVSYRGCVEKDELVNLCVNHVNSSSYRRRGQRSGTGPFSSFKGFTNNLNDLINQAFDLRNSPQPAPPPPDRGYCYNAAHIHTGSYQPRPQPQFQHQPQSQPQFQQQQYQQSQQPHARTNERFSTNPDGQPDIRPAVPAAAPPPPAASPLADTTDCFEIEDVDDAGWEFVARPADPLPNDSEVLLTAAEMRERLPRVGESPTPGSPPAPPPAVPAAPPSPPTAPPARASSLLELPRVSPDLASDNTDTASLQDEPHGCTQPPMEEPEVLEDDEAGVVCLQRVRSWSQLERLGARALKLLLARHRVDVAGVLERDELLQRARTLWDDHARYRDAIDSLPLEECCKICMAAPLECVLLECGHIAACVACARQLTECPICRRYVLRAVRCFKS